MRKRMIVVAILLLGCLGLIACSSSDSSSTKNENGDSKKGGKSAEVVTIDVFQFKVEFKDQFEELAAKYEEENENIKINIETVGGGSDYASVLKAKISSGEEPTIFNIGGPSDVEQYEDLLADVSDTNAAQAALEGTLTGVTQDGAVLGLPYNQEGYGMIYNKKVFEEADIDPSSIKSLEDLEAAAEAIDSKKDELGLQAVIAFPVKETWVTGQHLANVFLTPEFDGDVMKAYQANSVAFQHGEQMKEFIDFQNKYSVQPTLSLDYSQQVEELFSTGQVAMIQQGNWVYSTIESMDPELAENGIGILPIPLNSEMKMPVGVPNYWAVNKNKDDEEVQAAKDFLDWMYTSDTGKQFVLEEFKFIPAYEDYDESKIADPLSKEIYAYATEGETSGWTFNGYPVAWAQDILGANIQKYLGEAATWEEIVEESITEWEKSRE